jgi:hypothetical protein
VPSRGLCATGTHVTRQKAPRRRHLRRYTTPPPPPISPPPRLPPAPPLQCLPAGLLLWRHRRRRARTKRGDHIRPATPGALDPETIVPFWWVLSDIRCAGRCADGLGARRRVVCWYNNGRACVYRDADAENGKCGGAAAASTASIHDSETTHIPFSTTHIPCLLDGRADTLVVVFRCAQQRAADDVFAQIRTA